MKTRMLTPEKIIFEANLTFFKSLANYENIKPCKGKRKVVEFINPGTMFNLFGKKKKDNNVQQPILADLNGEPLMDGDIVMSLRYDLGKCRVIQDGKGIIYESLENGKQVRWTLMIDASTDLQKVKKVKPDENTTE